MDLGKDNVKCQELWESLNIVDVILKYITVLDQANTEEELNKIIPNLIKSIGKYTMSDCSYIFEWKSDLKQALNMTCFIINCTKTAID